MSTILQTPFVPENFPYLANRLLNYTLLMINSHPHRICEIEFYLNSSQHRDLYVHSHDDQTKKGTWYFHRFNNGTYKNGTFKGIDIALGSMGFQLCHSVVVESVHAAILIRTVIDINNKKIIEGPCKTVDHILSLSGYDSIMSFTENSSLGVLNNDRGLTLVEGNPNVLEPISFGPRIGLSDKYPEYRDKKYRFVIGPVKKEKKKLTPIII